MAKNKKEIAVKPIEVSLWDAAIKLRDSVESAQNTNIYRANAQKIISISMADRIISLTTYKIKKNNTELN